MRILFISYWSAQIYLTKHNYRNSSEALPSTMRPRVASKPHDCSEKPPQAASMPLENNQRLVPSTAAHAIYTAAQSTIAYANPAGDAAMASRLNDPCHMRLAIAGNSVMS